MNTNRMLQPKKRTRLRIWCGKKYYCLKRRIFWMIGSYRYAMKHSNQKLRYRCFEHQTILLRKLKDVDMKLQYNKIENLKIAVKAVNGIVIGPGETFSYWRLIGKPTKRKGYREGMVLFCGTFHAETGGGLCQLSNLIYWMALHTDLTITERYRHSYDVFPDSYRTQPFGSGATCVYNYRDLMITNETNKTYQINLNVSEKYLEGEICCSQAPTESYEVYEKEHYFQRELFGKYSRNNSLYRKIYDFTGEEIGDEYITENHALMMYEPFIEQM